MRHSIALPIAFLAGSLFAACGAATGMGKGVRTDVSAQMATTVTPVSACYEEALKRSRKVKGTVVLQFKIEPKTGKFTNVVIAQSRVGDAELEACVVSEVSKLALSKPQSTTIGIDSYPLRFSPTD